MSLRIYIYVCLFAYSSPFPLETPSRLFVKSRRSSYILLEQISCGVVAYVATSLISEEKHNEDLVTYSKAHACKHST
jgi:hypothetical protein